MVKDNVSRSFNESLKICVHPPYPLGTYIYLLLQYLYYQLFTVKLHPRSFINILKLAMYCELSALTPEPTLMGDNSL